MLFSFFIANQNVSSRFSAFEFVKRNYPIISHILGLIFSLLVEEYIYHNSYGFGANTSVLNTAFTMNLMALTHILAL